MAVGLRSFYDGWNEIAQLEDLVASKEITLKQYLKQIIHPGQATLSEWLSEEVKRIEIHEHEGRVPVGKDINLFKGRLWKTGVVRGRLTGMTSC